jgi:hypothetical protein
VNFFIAQIRLNLFVSSSRRSSLRSFSIGDGVDAAHARCRANLSLRGSSRFDNVFVDVK